MTLRPVTAADGPGIARVEQAAAHHPWSRSAIDGSLAQPTTLGFVVEASEVAGHLLSAVVADEAEVLILAVHPDHHRQGLARQLLEQGHAAWIARGVRSASLEVREDNHPALALYRSAGWEPSGRRPRYYADGTDALLFRWTAP